MTPRTAAATVRWRRKRPARTTSDARREVGVMPEGFLMLFSCGRLEADQTGVRGWPRKLADG